METKLISGKFGAQVALTVNNVNERVSLSQIYHFFDEVGAMDVFNALERFIAAEKKADIKAHKLNMTDVIASAVGKMLDMIPFELCDDVYTNDEGEVFPFRAIRRDKSKPIAAALQSKIDAAKATKAELANLADGFFE